MDDLLANARRLLSWAPVGAVASDVMASVRPAVQALADEVERLRAELAKPVAGVWDPLDDGGAVRTGVTHTVAWWDAEGWTVWAPDGSVAVEGKETGPEAEALADEAARTAGWRLT